MTTPSPNDVTSTSAPMGRESARASSGDLRILQRVPSVRFAIDVQDDESLPGIIARSAREHWLSKLDLILMAAGIETYTPGAVTYLVPTCPNRLA